MLNKIGIQHRWETAPALKSCVWSLLNKVCNSNGRLAGSHPHYVNAQGAAAKTNNIINTTSCKDIFIGAQKVNICPKMTQNASFGPNMTVLGSKTMIYVNAQGTKTNNIIHTTSSRMFSYMISDISVINTVVSWCMWWKKIVHCPNLLNFYISSIMIFIGPNSDYCLVLSVIDSVRGLFETWLMWPWHVNIHATSPKVTQPLLTNSCQFWQPCCWH